MKTKALKVIVIGDAGVGKTSLSNRHVSKIFTSNYRATIGADFLSKRIIHNEEEYSMQIWDTAGQERFRAIGSAFYRGSDCCVIVFDLTDKKSFENLKMWKNYFIEDGWVKDPETFPFVIIGNKCEEEDKRVVSRDKVESWCLESGRFSYFETSAKQDIGVDEAFKEVARLALQRLEKEGSEDEIGWAGNHLKRRKGHSENNEKKGLCC